MVVASLISMVIGYALLFYGDYLNINDGLSPGKDWIIAGIVISVIGIALLLVYIYKNKNKSLLYVDFIVSSGILLIGVIGSIVGQICYDSALNALKESTSMNILFNLQAESELLEKAELLANAGHQFFIWSAVIIVIGEFLFIFYILKYVFSTEMALSIYIVIATSISSIFLITQPLYGLLIPETENVGFNIKFFSFMSDSSDYDVSASIINLWCVFSFIVLLVSFASTIISQFMYIPKISMVSTIVNPAMLVLMFFGLMVIYSLFSGNLSVTHSLVVYTEYNYCLLLSMFILIANIIRMNIIENKN